jgi:histidinol phosphatase-like enzyme
MLLNAQKEFDIDFSSSYMIGDKRSDIQAGQAVGCKTILVETGCGGKGGEGCDVSPDFILKQLIQIRNIVNELS